MSNKEYYRKYYLEHKKNINNNSKKYYESNKEKTLKYIKQYAVEHKEEIKKYKHKYYLKNKEKLNDLNKKYYENNKQDILEQKKQYYEEYKEQIIEKSHKHYRKNKKKILDKHYQYNKNLYHNDINYKLGYMLRRRISSALKKGQKSGSAIRDLGCSISCLRFWIELQFYDNPETGEKMSWETNKRYGWHLDHIIPLSFFDLTDREQFLKAAHFTNLQPLWAKENLIKGNRVSF